MGCSCRAARVDYEGGVFLSHPPHGTVGRFALRSINPDGCHRSRRPQLLPPIRDSGAPIQVASEPGGGSGGSGQADMPQALESTTGGTRGFDTPGSSGSGCGSLLWRAASLVRTVMRTGSDPRAAHSET